MGDLTSQLYDLQRRRASDEANAANQQQSDALARRFAAQGGLNSGAYIKQQQIASDSAQQNKQKALEAVDINELGARAQQEEAQKQRDFQSSERVASQGYGTGERLGAQDFSGQQAAQQRAYGTSERVGGQDFAGQQAALQRAYGTQERLGAQDFTGGQNAATRGEQRYATDSDITARRDINNQNLNAAADEARSNRIFTGGQNELNRGLQQAQLTQSGNQFDKTYALQQIEDLITGGMNFANADNQDKIQGYLNQIDAIFQNHGIGPAPGTVGSATYGMPQYQPQPEKTFHFNPLGTPGYS